MIFMTSNFVGMDNQNLKKLDNGTMTVGQAEGTIKTIRNKPIVVVTTNRGISLETINNATETNELKQTPVPVVVNSANTNVADKKGPILLNPESRHSTQNVLRTGELMIDGVQRPLVEKPLKSESILAAKDTTLSSDTLQNRVVDTQEVSGNVELSRSISTKPLQKPLIIVRANTETSPQTITSEGSVLTKSTSQELNTTRNMIATITGRESKDVFKKETPSVVIAPLTEEKQQPSVKAIHNVPKTELRTDHQELPLVVKSITADATVQDLTIGDSISVNKPQIPQTPLVLKPNEAINNEISSHISEFSSNQNHIPVVVKTVNSQPITVENTGGIDNTANIVLSKGTSAESKPGFKSVAAPSHVASVQAIKTDGRDTIVVRTINHAADTQTALNDEQKTTNLISGNLVTENQSKPLIVTIVNKEQTSEAVNRVQSALEKIQEPIAMTNANRDSTIPVSNSAELASEKERINSLQKTRSQNSGVQIVRTVVTKNQESTFKTKTKNAISGIQTSNFGVSDTQNITNRNNLSNSNTGVNNTYFTSSTKVENSNLGTISAISAETTNTQTNDQILRARELAINKGLPPAKSVATFVREVIISDITGSNTFEQGPSVDMTTPNTIQGDMIPGGKVHFFLVMYALLLTNNCT